MIGSSASLARRIGDAALVRELEVESFAYVSSAFVEGWTGGRFVTTSTTRRSGRPYS